MTKRGELQKKMKELIDKYTDKLVSQGLVKGSEILFLAIDEEIYSNTHSDLQFISLQALKEVFGLMNINSLLFAVPEEPRRSIIRALLRHGLSELHDYRAIVPEDCETRTFFHDIPVIGSPDPQKIAHVLSERKSAVVETGTAIVSYGTISPEQAFISYSSACFSTFVKYFHDHLMYLETCKKNNLKADRERIDGFDRIKAFLYPQQAGREDAGSLHPLLKGPPEDEATVYSMIEEAVKRLVTERLVDSFFGNISCYFNAKIYISETAASLDELEGCIDAVPVDGSSSVGITSSSEFATHRATYRTTPFRFILHGHPKFSVIMSMHCLKECPLRGECYKACPEKRYVCGVPVVPGEVGTGPTGMVRTVPKAFKESDAAIVFGHGLFTAGEEDFNRPFQRMKEIEGDCEKEYFRIVGKLMQEVSTC